ncbi:MAG: type II secretion system protein [Opitutaceae bacterium]
MGFTLIELLTVIAVIAILAAILIPVLGKVRQSSNAAQSVSNLRQMGQALNVSLIDSSPQATIIGKGRYPGSWGTYGADGNWANFSWFDVLGEIMGFAELGTGQYDWVVPAHETVFQDPGYDVQFDPKNAGATGSYGYNRPGIGDGKVHPNAEVTASNTSDSLPALPVLIQSPAKFVVIAESNGDGKFDQTTWVGQGWPTVGAPTRYDGGGHYLFADGHVSWMHKDEVEEDPQQYFSRNP